MSNPAVRVLSVEEVAEMARYPEIQSLSDWAALCDSHKALSAHLTLLLNAERGFLRDVAVDEAKRAATREALDKAIAARPGFRWRNDCDYNEALMAYQRALERLRDASQEPDTQETQG